MREERHSVLKLRYGKSSRLKIHLIKLLVRNSLGRYARGPPRPSQINILCEKKLFETRSINGQSSAVARSWILLDHNSIISTWLKQKKRGIIMCTKRMVSIVVVLLLGLAAGASAGDLIVPEYTTYTVAGTESYEWVNVEGTLIVPSGTSLTGTERSRLNGPGAQIVVNGGSVLFTAYRFDLGQGDDGYIHLNGGTFTVSGRLVFPDDPGGEHRIYLNDGIMHCDSIDLIGERDAIMYVGDGVLRLDDIVGDDPQDWKDGGYLLAAEAGDEILIEYIAPEGAEIRAVVIDPARASNPDPDSGAGDVQSDADLSWQGPAGATYDVYMGTDPWNLLSVATGLLATTHDPGPLALETTYYWRVNSIVAGQTHQGHVWSFETAPPGIWTNAASSDSSWCTPGNWSGNVIPGPTDRALINPPPERGPVVASGCNVHVREIIGPADDSDLDQVMDITGGNLIVDDIWRWTTDGDGTGIINIVGTPTITVNGFNEENENLHWRGAEWTTGIVNICGNPTINVPNGFFRGGDKQGSRFIVNMNGGTLNCKAFRLGDEGICDLNLSNGTINVAEDLTLSVLRGLIIPQQTMNITGGSIIIGGTFWPVQGLAGTGTINLHCGTIECAAFEHGYDSDPITEAPYSMDFEQGQLIIAGDVTADILADIADGYMTAFGGADTVDVTYDQTADKTTVRAASWTGCTPPEPQCTVPEADAGDNIQVQTSDQASTVILGDANDPEGDPLLYRWLEGENELLGWTPVVDVNGQGQAYLDLETLLTPFSIGEYLLTLEVKDPRSTVTDEMILTIDNSPPEAQPAPSSQVVEIDVDDIVLNAQVSDFDGDTLSYQWLKGLEVLDSGSIATTQGGDPCALPELLIDAGDPNFPLGTHTIELLVSDGIYDVSVPVTVTVEDSTAPTIMPIPDTTILWPPNHELHPVTIQANAFDDGCPPVTLDAQVVSSEPDDDLGDGSTTLDCQVVSIDNADGGVIQLLLRAERGGKGDGRIYTVTITATDACGNSSEGIVEILAPHDKRKK